MHQSIAGSLLGRWPPEALFALAAAAHTMASAAAWTVTAAGYTNRSLTPAALIESVRPIAARGRQAISLAERHAQLVLDHQAGAAWRELEGRAVVPANRKVANERAGGRARFAIPSPPLGGPD